MEDQVNFQLKSLGFSILLFTIAEVQDRTFIITFCAKCCTLYNGYLGIYDNLFCRIVKTLRAMTYKLFSTGLTKSHGTIVATYDL